MLVGTSTGSTVYSNLERLCLLIKIIFCVIRLNDSDLCVLHTVILHTVCSIILESL